MKTETPIDDAAKKTRKYSPIPVDGVSEVWTVEDDHYCGAFSDIDKAQSKCDRMNLIAVLGAIREPTKKMLEVSACSVGEGAWKDMIDVLINEVRCIR